MVSWNKMLILSSLEQFQSDPLDTLSKITLGFEKIYKVFKNEVQGRSNL